MQGHWEKARQAYARALELEPESATALVNLSHLQLLSADFTQGFKNYAARPLLPSMSIPPSDKLPFWDGLSSLQQTAIYILPEQGFGDYFLFIRFSEQLKARGATVIAVCEQNMFALIRTVPWVDEVYTAQQFASCAQGYQAPIMELARVLQITAQTIPCHVPYLFADADKIKQMASHFTDKSALKIGLVWSGNPAFPGNAKRSIPFNVLQPLLKIPNTQFYSLMMNERVADLALYPNSVIEMHPFIHDFSDTAAIVQHLDLVISVDTSLVHLVGALNKPCWLLLSDVPYWCWQLDRSDSPWYPSLRLFRQATPGEWGGVIESVIAAICRVCP